MDLNAQKLDELLELTRENNDILVSMRRTQRWSSFFSFMYWVLILGSIFGTYYYFQPTIIKYTKILQTSVDVLQKFEGTTGSVTKDAQTIKKLIGK
ncbi:MAG: hypothetical protein HY228_01830 [Candidatus Yonathbacteria bacterium]|nr:hypothetical protein [Candidatus Yonathbacteria bacterium]